MAKKPHVVREVKVSQTIDLKGVKVSSLLMKNLLGQLQLCIATGSLQNIFARPPASFATFCPLLARGAIQIPVLPPSPIILSVPTSGGYYLINRTPWVVVFVEYFVVVPDETREELVAKEVTAILASLISVADNKGGWEREAAPMELIQPLLGPL